MQNFKFEDVRHALTWATEHMRRKSFPKVSKIYMEGARFNRSSNTLKEWAGWRETLPQDAEEAFLLATKVYKAIHLLPETDRKMIFMKYWGDYYDKAVLMRALRTQEALRQRGKRVRLNYRYSSQLIGNQLDMNYRKVHREIARIEESIEQQLIAWNLLQISGNMIAENAICQKMV